MGISANIHPLRDLVSLKSLQNATWISSESQAIHRPGLLAWPYFHQICRPLHESTITLHVVGGFPEIGATSSVFCKGSQDLYPILDTRCCRCKYVHMSVCQALSWIMKQCGKVNWDQNKKFLDYNFVNLSFL